MPLLVPCHRSKTVGTRLVSHHAALLYCGLRYFVIVVDAPNINYTSSFASVTYGMAKWLKVLSAHSTEVLPWGLPEARVSRQRTAA